MLWYKVELDKIQYGKIRWKFRILILIYFDKDCDFDDDDGVVGRRWFVTQNSWSKTAFFTHIWYYIYPMLESDNMQEFWTLHCLVYYK